MFDMSGSQRRNPVVGRSMEGLGRCFTKKPFVHKQITPREAAKDYLVLFLAPNGTLQPRGETASAASACWAYGLRGKPQDPYFLCVMRRYPHEIAGDAHASATGWRPINVAQSVGFRID